MLTSSAVWGLIIAQIGHDWGLFTIVTDLPKYMRQVLHYKVSQVSDSSNVREHETQKCVHFLFFSLFFVERILLGSSVRNHVVIGDGLRRHLRLVNQKMCSERYFSA